MADRAAGWVYRNPSCSEERLREFIAPLSRGWVWTSAEMRAVTPPQTWLGDQGQLYDQQREVRWRRQDDTFDVLILSLGSIEEQAFELIRPLGSDHPTWEIQPGTFLLQGLGRDGSTANSVTFVAPNGAPQWVALIG